MSFVITIVCFVFVIISYFTTKKVYSPMFLFNTWWGISIFLSGLGLFDMYVPSSLTYIIMLISILSFNLPQLISFSSNRKKVSVGFDELGISKNQYKIINGLIFLNIIIIFLLIPRTIKAINLLMSGVDYSTVRYLYYYGQGNFMTIYDHLITNWLITPINYFNMIVLSILYFNENKEFKSKKYFGLTTFISVGLYSFSSGSRGILIKMAIIFLLSFFIHSRKTILSSCKKLRLRMIIISLFLVLIYMTVKRSGIEVNMFTGILRTVSGYFTAPFIYFEKLHEHAYVNNEKVFLFGGMFFSGIIDIIVMALRFLGANILQPSYYLAEHNQTFLMIGKDRYYNAFPTMNYSFLYDFGYLGIIIGPLLFGIIAKKSYEKLVTTNKISNKGIYIMICIAIYESTMKWWGTSSTFWITIILFLIFDYFSNRKIVFKK